MKILLIPLLAALLVMPAQPIMTDSPYMHGVLSYLAQCSPASYQFVKENVRSIRVITSGAMNSGEAEYNPAGEITIQSYLLESPDQYFPGGHANRYLAQLIVHEARHEWQFGNWWSLFLSPDPAVHTFLEQDAASFAARAIYDCP